MLLLIYLSVVIFCLQECELDPCCEGSTCKLKSFAECAYGDCCKDCQARTSPYQEQIREGKWISGIAPSEISTYYSYHMVILYFIPLLCI